jgi:hypothetical protein
MAYALQSLLRIRQMREDRAASELTVARREVANAQRTLEARQADLAAYEATKEARRNRIFDAIVGRAVSMDDLDLVREGIARIDEEGVLKADNVVQARAELKKRTDAAEQTRMAFVVASKNRMKITEHRVIWTQAENEASEHRQEAELEDFTGKKVIDDAAFDGD